MHPGRATVGSSETSASTGRAFPTGVHAAPGLLADLELTGGRPPGSFTGSSTSPPTSTTARQPRYIKGGSSGFVIGRSVAFLEETPSRVPASHSLWTRRRRAQPGAFLGRVPNAVQAQLECSCAGSGWQPLYLSLHHFS